MTIDEAVERMLSEQHDHHSFDTDTLGKAMLLGVQGLKRIQEARIGHTRNEIHLLPGETHE